MWTYVSPTYTDQSCETQVIRPAEGGGEDKASVTKPVIVHASPQQRFLA